MKDEFEIVFNARGKLHEIHSKANFNIRNLEEVFSAFEMASVIGKLADYKESEIEKIIPSFIKVIVRTIENELKFPVENKKIKPPPQYEEFANLIYYLKHEANPKHSVSIITFNYDFALDLAICYKLSSCSYGLEGPIRDIKLFKLHGSLNWGKCPKCGKVTTRDLNYLLSKQYERVNIEDGHVKNPISTIPLICNSCSEKFQNTVPLIIPPTWDKFYNSTDITRVWGMRHTNLVKHKIFS